MSESAVPSGHHVDHMLVWAYRLHMATVLAIRAGDTVCLHALCCLLTQSILCTGHKTDMGLVKSCAWVTTF